MTSPSKFKRQLPKLVGVAVVVLVAVGFVRLIQNFLDAEPPRPVKKVQEITLVQPPPPPPPKPEEPPPEPELEDEVEVPEPEPEAQDLPDPAQDMPAGEQLGLDAEGGAGGDAFGLIGRKGGRGLLAGAGDPKMMYAGRWIERIQDALGDNPELKKKAFSVPCTLWIAPDGNVRSIRLSGSTGDAAIDDEIVRTVERLAGDGELPPPDLGAIRFRIKVSL